MEMKQIGAMIVGAFALGGSAYIYKKLKNQFEIDSRKCMLILNELEIDSYPMATLIYLKYRNSFLQQNLQQNQELKDKIDLKLQKSIQQNLIQDLCNKYGVQYKIFLSWYQSYHNQRSLKLQENLEKAIKDIQDGQSPKSLDYELREDLKKRDILTLIYRKYLDLIKYKTFENIKQHILQQGKISEDQKLQIIKQIQEESLLLYWDQIFENVGVMLNDDQNSYIEFKKAYNKLNFDYVWHQEMQKLENEHYWIMGSFLTQIKQKITNEILPNPLELGNELYNYNFDTNLHFLKENTHEYVSLMIQKYKVLLKQEPGYLELKLQKFLDKNQARINANNNKNYQSYATQMQTNTGLKSSKSIRSFLSKDSEKKINQQINLKSQMTVGLQKTFKSNFNLPTIEQETQLLSKKNDQEQNQQEK